jgi:hypothetical protein
VRRTALIAALLLALALPAGGAIAQSPTTTGPEGRPGGGATPSTESRIGGRRGGGFGRSARPTTRRSRPGARPSQRRPARRRPAFPGGFLGSVLRFLGIAYLVNLLFGWGPGGSPLGLLVVLGAILWLVTRRRRRAYHY